jgi:hypothetical protein
MTDSTTVEGWLKKSNFSKLGESKIQSLVRVKAAWMEATLFMSLGIKNYSQWFKGESNEVFHALSRDNNQDDKELINIFCAFCPSHIPSHFRIVPLPSKITSWLIALLQKLPMNQQFNKVHTRSKLGRGNDGASTTNALGTTTSSSNISHDINESKSLKPLPWLCKKDGFWDQLMTNWLKAQSQVPFHMYAQPSEKMASQTHPSTKMPGLDSFYSNSIGASKTQTQQRNTKRLSQCVSSQRLEKRQSLSSPLQFPNLPALQSSLHADLVNTSRYLLPTNTEQQSFNFTTLDSSGMANSSATRCRIRVLGLHLVDFWKAKERQENGHRHSNGFRRLKALSGLCSSSYRKKNQR